MLDELHVDAILPAWDRLQWHYSIELCPGIYTTGFEFNNIALTKKMLFSIDLDGTTAIDISAMEGDVRICPGALTKSRRFSFRRSSSPGRRGWGEADR